MQDSDAKLRELGTETRHLAQSRVASRLDGKWLLDALLGYGGSAAVYAATHRNGKRAAIKVLHPHCVADENLRNRFVREGYVANKIDHPGAVSVLDDDIAEDGTVYLVMELLEGTSLEKAGRGEAPPPTMADVVRIADDLLDVLAKAHALGIVHRDIKPANLFITTAGQLKVLDFGIARLAEATPDGAGATQTGFMMGTPAFMPPEQARARWAEVDARSDLWAVGATMIALMTGRRPRSAETPNEELLLAMTAALPAVSSIVPNLPSPIAAIIDRAVAFNRDERWPDARAMQQALRSAARESQPNLNAPGTAVYGASVPPPVINATLVAPHSGQRTGPSVQQQQVSSPVSAVPDVEHAHGLTTGRAVLHSAPPYGEPKKSSAGVLGAIVGVVIALGLLGAGGLYARSRGVFADRATTQATDAPPANVAPEPVVSPSPVNVAPEPAVSAEGTATAAPAPTPAAVSDDRLEAAGSGTPPAATTTAAAASASAKVTKPAPRPQGSGAADPSKYFDSRF
ncbi:MAG: hypothetical protein BGO98_00325 [Myxococcales bacterium 68-20]|nr:MAG: hypothetical protein BGO98_00325 [Myxococcales bacterium 68-20]